MTPEVGNQSQFKKKKAPKTYRYDSSLAPEPGRDVPAAVSAMLTPAAPRRHVRSPSRELKSEGGRVGVSGPGFGHGPQPRIVTTKTKA